MQSTFLEQNSITVACSLLSSRPNKYDTLRKESIANFSHKFWDFANNLWLTVLITQSLSFTVLLVFHHLLFTLDHTHFHSFSHMYSYFLNRNFLPIVIHNHSNACARTHPHTHTHTHLFLPSFTRTLSFPFSLAHSQSLTFLTFSLTLSLILFCWPLAHDLSLKFKIYHL